MHVTRASLTAMAVVVAASLSGCAVEDTGSTGGGDASETVSVGVLTSLSGPNAVTGEMWVDGFEAGLEYATDGTSTVGDKAIEVVKADDQSDPNVGITEATSLVSDGVGIIAGTQSSGIALGLADFAAENDILYITGSANSNDITGINENTFRGSRQAYQDVQAVVSIIGDDVQGADVTLLAHDIAYGQSLVATLQPILEAGGATVTVVLAPFPTDDVAPFVQQVKDSNPDILVPFWSGDVDPLWNAFKQQDIFAATTVISNVGTRGTFPTFESIDSPNVKLYNSWSPDVDNEATRALLEATAEVDYIATDGFLAAQMIVKALEDGDDTAGYIAALEGATFDGPRGETTVRAEDHALIAPMYVVEFENGDLVALETLDSEALTPPIS
jgi:branched-chain amino acid transport system substrate-binding protein